jgi:hypothetical protein
LKRQIIQNKEKLKGQKTKKEAHERKTTSDQKERNTIWRRERKANDKRKEETSTIREFIQRQLFAA